MSGETTGPERLQMLIRDLPFADERSSDGCLVGLLVPKDPGLVCLVAGAHAFSFAAADVLDVAPLEGVDAVVTGPLGVRLTLKAPATLVKVENWAEFQHAALGTRRPFAYATRPHPIIAPPRTEFRELELRFGRTLE
jgi:hypothetical protein